MSRSDRANRDTSDSLSFQIRIPLLALLFVASGCSALVYEIVWFQQLRLVVGSSAVSLGVLLGTFMGGMCLGSIGLPRVISDRHHPLLVYAVLELLIGVIGAALLFIIPLIGTVYVSIVGHGLVGILLRGLVAVVCLLPPTVLMGATLPAIARWISSTRQGVSWLGFFYASNIAGAVFGCLLAGFYLLRIYDVATATFVAVGINLAVFVLASLLALVSPHRIQGNVSDSEDEANEISASGVIPYLVICLSGMCSLGAEVIWTRQLSLLLGASVYTFSIILAVFLMGLGIGSTTGSVLAKHSKKPQLLLALCQMFACAAIAWSAYTLGASLPYWPIDPSVAASPTIVFQIDIARCMWAMLPAAILWGASFPLALACVAGPGRDTGKLVGGVYAANTVGAIVGAIGFSMISVSWIGTQASQQILVAASALSAVLILGTVLFGRSRFDYRVVAAAATVLAFVILIPSIRSVPSAPKGLIGYGRFLAAWYPDEQPDYIYVGEGMNASIAVSDSLIGFRNFHVSGKVVASSDPADMRLQRMLGHIPAVLHDGPKSALIVGCGAGVTSGSFVVHPDMERIVICEIEPLIPPAAKEYFGEENHHVLADTRTEVMFDDARHFVATTDEKFDIITSDPIHPWVKGAAALYSREYYELCKERLNDGGFITQWVPLYESNEAAVKSEIATFLEAFPNGTIWGNDIAGEGYDIIMLAQKGETKIDYAALSDKLASEPYQEVKNSLADVDLDSAEKILARYAGDAESLEEWLADAEINRDSNMRLQYLAGMGLNSYKADEIYSEIIKDRVYPEKLIISSPAEEYYLRMIFEVGPEIDSNQ